MMLRPVSLFTTVGDIVHRHPSTAALFGRLGVHPCCYGDLILPAAATIAGLSFTELVQALQRNVAEAGERVV